MVGSGPLNSEIVVGLLEDLDRELDRAGGPAELYLAGGARMLLGWRTDRRTSDLDGVMRTGQTRQWNPVDPPAANLKPLGQRSWVLASGQQRRRRARGCAPSRSDGSGSSTTIRASGAERAARPCRRLHGW